MDLNDFHFTHPLWFLCAVAIPLVWIVYYLFSGKRNRFSSLEKHIDAHLLPYLLINSSAKKKSFWKALLLWSIVWTFLTLALAGPRWSFREMETFSQDQSLVILLDLSESMNATDVKPSRLIRAKQKMEDLLKISKSVKIGLIAFAADSHMIAPLTDDLETIRHLLSSLDTELVYIQGSRLAPALDMAATMLDAEPGDNKALLVISDGGFEDSSAIITAKNLAAKGIVINSMGIGTVEGTHMYNGKKSSNINGSPFVTKLETERLKEISHVGNGRYLDGHYSDREVVMILDDLSKKADNQLKIGKKNQFWDEHFYLLILPILPITLWWYRRGSLFATIFVVFTSLQLHGGTANDYFMNSEQLGKQAFDEGNYESSIDAFQDPYRKGVACYKAKKFAEAEKMFLQSNRSDVATQTNYNLGNAQAQQQKYKEAIATYKKILKSCPEHIKAKENLELVKKLLKQQKQNDSNSDNSDQQDDSEENDSDNKEGSKDNKDSKNSKDKNKSEDNQDSQKDKDSDQNEDQQNSEDSGESDKNENENEDSEGQQENQQEMEQSESDQKDQQESKAMRSQEDQDADQWLNQIENDPKTFLKNKFYIESKRNGTKEGIDPW
ncbi:MAG: VWA domain-containing protein [Parachlamydiaceae bacterium]|nr:VWA domain-containing protein [Parachlamydiaceae bacterium]